MLSSSPIFLLSLLATMSTSKPLLSTLTTGQVQTATETAAPESSAYYVTSLEPLGNPSVQPFVTSSIPAPDSTIKPLLSGPNVIDETHVTHPTLPTSVANVFAPFASGPPLSILPTNKNHPVPRKGIKQTAPIQTNKFYANFFLGNRQNSTWTHPYSISWVAGQAPTNSWGIAIAQTTRSQYVYGPGTPASYFFNPVGLDSIILSAKELGGKTSLTMSQLTAFSANVHLAASPGGANVLTLPVVQGMGFTTARYTGSTPLLQSSIYFKSLTYEGNTFGAGTAKYIITLMDGTNWVMYVTPLAGVAPTFTLIGDSKITTTKTFKGFIQIGKIPPGAKFTVYDPYAGVYAETTTVKGSANKQQGSYTLSFQKQGIANHQLLMWALPHHVQTFDATTAKNKLALQLWTTTKGLATAVTGNSWTMTFTDLPYGMQFNPWSPTLGSVNTLPQAAVAAMNQAAEMELSENITTQTVGTDSMYYAGKGLAKFATIIISLTQLGNNSTLASAGLVQLKNTFATFVNNQQQTPLLYDASWGGVPEAGGYTDQGAADFGNSYYNDHHFHYGYFVYTAAVIGWLDPTWLTEGNNLAFVNTLLRDYSNSVDDAYFPFSRMFDWYHGHSWATGLFPSQDGKNQESSSEDTFSAYAIKMWGRTIGNAALEARGNLMLAIQARSLQDYYLMISSNTIEPAQYVPNKAAGILFENKITHTTFFGSNIEYIEGIHMLPVNPCSALIRTPTFVSQEWNMYFSNGRVNNITSGWRGILLANYAIINATSAYKFFSGNNFQQDYLDSGASLTWYIAYSAGLGGAA